MIVKQRCVFMDAQTATMAAVEYVCDKFKFYPWFNHQLKILLSKLHLISNLESFHPPLIIYTIKNDSGKDDLEYDGYHFLISEMEKFKIFDNISKWYSLLIVSFYISVVISLYIMFYVLHKLFISKSLIIWKKDKLINCN